MSSGKINKVVYAGSTLIDLTGDTVDSSTLKSGTTAHDSTGKQITGALTVPASQTKTVELSMASGNQVISPDSGKVLSKVTVTKPATLIPENIKKDVNIGGVVGTAATGASFPNGTEWTKSNISNDVSVGITYVNYIWVASSASGIYYSTDGKTWTKSNITAGVNPVIYGNNIFITSNTLFTSKDVYYSTDGKTWSTVSAPLSCWYVCGYGGGVFVGSSSGSTRNGFYYSTDGKTWTQSNIKSGYARGGCYANGLWVVTDNSYAYYSTNGKTWTKSTAIDASYLVFYYNELWIIVSGSNTNSNIYYSADGKTWTASSTSPGNGYDIMYSNDLWVGCFSTGIWYSTDGKTWTQSNVTSDSWGNVSYSCGVWVVCTNNAIYYSMDGKKWEIAFPINYARGRGANHDANGIRVAGTKIGIYYSITWEAT